MQDSFQMITPKQGRALLKLARKTLMERFGRKYSQGQEAELSKISKEPELQTVCGTFVTLKIGQQLRGCIGSLEGSEPLLEGVKTHAVNAAFHDPRFRSLSGKELDQINIEVSVLSKPVPLKYTDSSDLLAKLRPRVDGVTIRSGYCSATFLPQVWDQLADPEVFMTQLCRKAGMRGDAWKGSRLEVETYQVQYFEEQETNGLNNR
jgi:AmmeMemoRadiSam system protein A